MNAGIRASSASARWIAVAGALLVGSGVALGAFGSHLLAPRLSAARLDTFETAVLYQFVHGLGLLAVAALNRPGGGLAVPAALLLAGVSVFSGSLYLLVATDVGLFGATAPIGGAGMVLGWLLLAYRLLRSGTGGRPQS